MNTNTLSSAPTVSKSSSPGDAHDPSLYAAASVAPKVNGFDGLTSEHYDFYEQEGYLAIENAFTPEQVTAASKALVDLIMGTRPDFEGVSFETEAEENLELLTCLERQDAVRKLMGFVEYDERLKAMSSDAGLLSVVGRILGERPQMFQDMALIKPPRMGREKPWHQDKAYFNYPVSTKVVGVWIALDPATIENGCMHVQPQGHHKGPIVHFKRRDWQICDTEIMGKSCVAAPLQPGGLLLFDGLLPHGTPTNYSQQRRKALQFHYAGISAEAGAVEERLALFGSEGRDVTC